ncbi:MAG TPA: hypothetical protein V6C89_10340 [Drouetiella sp.]
MNDIVIKLGELLVRAGIVTGVDLSEAEKLAKHMNLQFGQVLIMSGCLSEHDLDCALVAQQLIREELLTVDVACQALAMASQNQIPFEDALEALSVVPKYGAASVEMAELLADAAIIPGELLEQALMTSLTTNVSLGELLVRENAISSSLIPVLNVMLADIGNGGINQEHAITEIRKNHYNWQRAESGASITPTPPPARTQEPSPVFVSQELMHAYEVYQPKTQSQPPQHQQQQQPAPGHHPQPIPQQLPQQVAQQPSQAVPQQQPPPQHPQSPLQYPQAPQQQQSSPQHPQLPQQQQSSPQHPQLPHHQQSPQYPHLPQHQQSSPQYPQLPQYRQSSSQYPQLPHHLQSPSQHQQLPQHQQSSPQHPQFPQHQQSSPQHPQFPQHQQPAAPPESQAPLPNPAQGQQPVPSAPPYPAPSPSASQQAPATPPASLNPPAHSIHDVLSMFQQRNPVPESASQAVARDQQAASWSAFVQSQSFDPNDVEPSTPPISVASDEPRSRHPEEVVQGTYAKTFDGKKSAELLPETFEQPVPDFEPAAELIEVEKKSAVEAKAPERAPEPSAEEQPGDDEQFSLLVELLIESSYFDREDIIEAITNALKEESKAARLLETLNLVDEKAIMAASICADALRSEELTSGEAVSVLSDIKNGAEIHEALESVNLELAVTVSANLQMMYDDEIDETFYVGDVSRTIDIFEPDDFVDEASVPSTKKTSTKENPVPSTKETAQPDLPPPVVEVKDDTPPIAFGYGRDRLKISKRSEPIQEEPKESAPATPVAPQPAAPGASSAQERPQTGVGGKKVSSLSEVFEQLSGVDSQANLTPAPPGQQSLSEVFEQLSGVENQANVSPPAPNQQASTPKPFSQVPAQTPTARTASSAPGSNPASRTGSHPVVKPLGTPPGAFGKPSLTPAQAKSGSASPHTGIGAPDPAQASNQPSDTTSGAALPDASRPVDKTHESGKDSSPSTATPDSGSVSEEDKKAVRKRNSTTFNSLQAVFVPAADQLATTTNTDAQSSATDQTDSALPEVAAMEPISSEATSQYAAYVANKPGDDVGSEESQSISETSQSEKVEIEDLHADAQLAGSAQVETTFEAEQDSTQASNAQHDANHSVESEVEAESNTHEHVATAEAARSDSDALKKPGDSDEMEVSSALNDAEVSKGVEESNQSEVSKDAEVAKDADGEVLKDAEVSKDTEALKDAEVSRDADVPKDSESAADENAEEEEAPVAAGSKKKSRPSKAKVRGGAKNGAPAPKKSKRRK